MNEEQKRLLEYSEFIEKIVNNNNKKEPAKNEIEKAINEVIKEISKLNHFQENDLRFAIDKFKNKEEILDYLVETIDNEFNSIVDDEDLEIDKNDNLDTYKAYIKVFKDYKELVDELYKICDDLSNVFLFIDSIDDN